jgi:hypothetical protein
MEAADDEEGLRRLDGDVARSMRAKAECRAVDGLHRPLGRGVATRAHGKPVDAVAVIDEPLEMIEMQADVVLSTRDLGRVGTAAHYPADDHGVAGTTGCRCENDAVSYTECRVVGQGLVYRYATRRSLKDREQRDEMKNQDVRAGSDERGCATQRAVSFTVSRVSSSVYDGCL